ncbi:hypothetical protein E4U59_004723 [Claviceps monticola]|nr:hypothetical protein E4U59_004723 [Claviceps monticola]
MLLRPRALPALRRLPILRHQYARSFGFSSRPGTSPAMDYIPMPYIEETSERIICLNGEINDYMSASIVSQLLWLESDTPDKPITMYINSPGGSVTSGMSSHNGLLCQNPTDKPQPNTGMAIYDTMAYIKSPVSTVCVGGAASMAAILLAGGEAGKRYALPHSSIMIHQPLGGTHGQASDILIYANQIQRIREQSNKIMRHHLNLAKGEDRYSLEEVNDMMERDKYMSVREALEVGVIDEILTKRPETVEGEENKRTQDGKEKKTTHESEEKKKEAT